MIYTVTLNPSLDYTMVFKETRLGELNRSSRELHLLGGKGINVSVVLGHLGIESTCLGFIAGYVGEEIESRLQKKGCRTAFTHLEEGCTRINVKVKEISGRETEMNGSGPAIHKRHLDRLKASVEKIQTGDLLILSGSVPTGVPEDFYGQLAADARARGGQVAADTEGRYLFPVLPCRPLLIKPNLHELNEMTGGKIHTQKELRARVRSLKDRGARNILVSMGKDGAYFMSEKDEEFFIEAPKGTVVNSVGAGDSMVAGFLSRYIRGGDTEENLRYGVAAGSAGAFSETLPERSQIELLAGRVNINKL